PVIFVELFADVIEPLPLAVKWTAPPSESIDPALSNEMSLPIPDVRLSVVAADGLIAALTLIAPLVPSPTLVVAALMFPNSAALMPSTPLASLPPRSVVTDSDADLIDTDPEPAVTALARSMLFEFSE